jgi:hypothetical protein
MHRAVREVVTRVALNRTIDGWDDQRFRQQFEPSNQQRATSSGSRRRTGR